MPQMKINKLEIENVKRVKAVKIEPTKNGLTVIGGHNNQGKTSVLDAIAWALGGNKFKPSDPHREGSVVPPTLHITMSNGLVVERKGKNSDLKVIDPNGDKAGQQLLDTFVEELALNLPKFMRASNKEKANALLQIIGIGDKLYELEQKETTIYNERHAIGQISDRKKKFADEQPYHPDAPKELISASDLIKQQQAILAKNGENEKHRHNKTTLEQAKSRLVTEIAELESKLEAKRQALVECNQKLDAAAKTVEQLKDESTAEIEKNINDIEAINIKVRANLDKEKAEDDARDYQEQYSALTTKLEGVRQSKYDLLKGANLPLPGLSVKDGELIYNEHKWDNMSGSDQLKVATAIVRKLKPNCGFVLLDKLEQMDLVTLQQFSDWLEAEGLQAIATRVSTGDECSIIIEDGYIKGEERPEPEQSEWKAGEF